MEFIESVVFGEEYSTLTASDDRLMLGRAGRGVILDKEESEAHIQFIIDVFVGTGEEEGDEDND